MPFITSFKIWNAGVIVITRSTFFSFIFFKFLLFQFLKGKRWHFLPHRICLCQLYPMKMYQHHRRIQHWRSSWTTTEKGRKCNVRVLSEYSLSDERRLHSSQVTQITIKLNTNFVIFLSVYFHMINSTKWKASRWSWLVCHSMFTYVEFRVIPNECWFWLWTRKRMRGGCDDEEK